MKVYYEDGINRYASMLNELKAKEYRINPKFIEQHRMTKVGKRILIFQCIVVVVLLSAIPITGYAAYNLSRVVYDKVKNSGYTEDEIEDLSRQLSNYGFTEEDLSGFDELKVNKNGQTYGPDAFGADLILVELSDGTMAYIYRTDFEEATAPPKDLDHINSPESVELNAYAEDGETVLGVFIISAEEVQ
ncbi:MAG: hypothetical protein K5851_07465 [Lachnospiraceae bacterium]|nr:hypothetical protein [Lachnospiraceae bacterium]